MPKRAELLQLVILHKGLLRVPEALAFGKIMEFSYFWVVAQSPRAIRQRDGSAQIYTLIFEASTFFSFWKLTGPFQRCISTQEKHNFPSFKNNWRVWSVETLLDFFWKIILKWSLHNMVFQWLWPCSLDPNQFFFRIFPNSLCSLPRFMMHWAHALAASSSC